MNAQECWEGLSSISLRFPLTAEERGFVGHAKQCVFSIEQARKKSDMFDAECRRRGVMTYDKEETIILEFVKGFVDRVDEHRLDTDALLYHIGEIITQCENLAEEIEKGCFEKEPDDSKRGE